MKKIDLGEGRLFLRESELTKNSSTGMTRKHRETFYHERLGKNPTKGGEVKNGTKTSVETDGAEKSFVTNRKISKGGGPVSHTKNRPSLLGGG